MIEMAEVLALNAESIGEMDDEKLADFIRFISTCVPADMDELKEVNDVQDLILEALG